MGSASEIENNQILLFDGVCNLCNGFINFIIDRDKNHQIKFASLQSDFAAELMASRSLDPDYFDSVVLIKGSETFVKSRAALEILKTLGFPWKLFYAGIIIPEALRNVIYDWIARNRYGWFGKRDTCRVPTPELKERFLDS